MWRPTCAYAKEDAKWQAQLTFAISRHAVADLCEVLRVRPANISQDRLPPQDATEVRDLLVKCGATGTCNEAGDLKLKQLREMYEPYLNGLSQRLLMPIPSWGVGAQFVENWKRSAWGKISSGPPGAGSSTGYGSDHF